MADDEGTKVYERIVESRGIIKRNPANPDLIRMMRLTLDALEMLFRPPTEEEVDASLERIYTADELAHKVAGLLLRYKKEDRPRSLDVAAKMWDELTAAVEEYEEAIQ